MSAGSLFNIVSESAEQTVNDKTSENFTFWSARPHVVTSEGGSPKKRSSLKELKGGTINDSSLPFSPFPPRTKMKTCLQFTGDQNTSLCLPGHVMLNSSAAFLLHIKYTPCVSPAPKNGRTCWGPSSYSYRCHFFAKHNSNCGACTIATIPLVLESPRTHLSSRNPKPEARDMKSETMNHDP